MDQDSIGIVLTFAGVGEVFGRWRQSARGLLVYIASLVGLMFIFSPWSILSPCAQVPWCSAAFPTASGARPWPFLAQSSMLPDLDSASGSGCVYCEGRETGVEDKGRDVEGKIK